MRCEHGSDGHESTAYLETKQETALNKVFGCFMAMTRLELVTDLTTNVDHVTAATMKKTVTPTSTYVTTPEGPALPLAI